MTSYLLDTSVIIQALKGNPTVVSFLESSQHDINTSYVCLAELYDGVHRVSDRQKAEDQILGFTSTLGQIYTLDLEVAKHFGRMRAHLKKAGLVIEDLDILIAATCVANNLTLVTLNPKHFSRISSLKIQAL